MFYGDTRLIAPKQRLNPEFYVPDAAMLAGVCYDYSEHCIMVYDRSESKIMWIHKDTEAIFLSVEVPLPTATDVVIDMCSIEDLVYLLIYKGAGKMSVAHGAISQGKQDASLMLTEYPMPNQTSLPPGMSVWTATHTSALRYMNYHPLFTSMFNVGRQLYIVAGMASNVTAFNPTELGQWVLQYDVSGLVTHFYKADDSTAVNARPEVYEETKLNGRIIASTTHDGIIAGIALSDDNAWTGAVKLMKPMNSIYSTKTLAFLTGPFDQCSSMCAVGRTLYHTANGRLFRSTIFTFDIWCATEDGFESSTIDMGTIHAGTSTKRKVFIRNSSPLYDYYALDITVKKPGGIVLSLTGEQGTWGENIRFTGPLAPGEEFSFYVQILAPELPEELMPYQFYEDLIITSAMDWSETYDA